MWEFALLLLPVAAGSGWFIGKKNHLLSKTYSSLGSDYYKGLNYLLNEQPDKALDAFIRMLDANPDAVETTLALGNFFRRRGEVDKAIRIHQNLIAKPNLTHRQRSQSLLELAQDYMRAGVYDRAESLFLDLLKKPSDQSEISLKHLIDIFEREKEWEKAIPMAKHLQQESGVYMGKEIAHYYCEIAENAFAHNKLRQALLALSSAKAHDKVCVRSSILLANIEKSQGKYKQALKAYKQVQYQDPDFVCEVIIPIQQCYEKLNAKEDMLRYLDQVIKSCPHISVVLATAAQYKRFRGDREAAVFLAEHMREKPSIRGIRHLVDYHLVQAKEEVRDDLLILRCMMDKLLENKPTYRCNHCGFSTKTLHWQCPSCRQWSSIKPIHRIDGE